MSIRSFLARDVRMRHLRLLVAIEDAGQLTRAARVMHVTQPALSKALAEIEQALGTRLFERTSQGLTPTPTGETLIRAARSALAELDRASNELHQVVPNPRRILHVGCMPTASWAILAEALPAFRKQHAQVSVSVIDGQTAGLLTQLVAGRIDLVIGAMWRTGLPADVEAVNLFEDSMRLVVAAHHPLSRQRKLDWSGVCAYPMVLQPVGHPIRIAFDRAVRRCGWASPEQIYEALQADTMLALLRPMQAVGFMPGRLAQHLSGERLVRVLPAALSDRLAVPLPFTAFFRSGSRQDPVMDALLRSLQTVV